MEKLQAISLEKGRQSDLGSLLNEAEKEIPGVSELLKVYGGYEEAVRAMQEYLEMTKPQPYITTLNQSCPTS